VRKESLKFLQDLIGAASLLLKTRQLWKSREGKMNCSPCTIALMSFAFHLRSV
jgi:hypothetical protein